MASAFPAASLPPAASLRPWAELGSLSLRSAPGAGTIDLEEFSEMLKDWSLAFTDEEVISHFTDMDTNQNGRTCPLPTSAPPHGHPGPRGGWLVAPEISELREGSEPWPLGTINCAWRRGRAWRGGGVRA